MSVANITPSLIRRELNGIENAHRSIQLSTAESLSVIRVALAQHDQAQDLERDLIDAHRVVRRLRQRVKEQRTVTHVLFAWAVTATIVMLYFALN